MTATAMYQRCYTRCLRWCVLFALRRKVQKYCCGPVARLHYASEVLLENCTDADTYQQRSGTLNSSHQLWLGHREAEERLGASSARSLVSGWWTEACCLRRVSRGRTCRACFLGVTESLKG